MFAASRRDGSLASLSKQQAEKGADQESKKTKSNDSASASDSEKAEYTKETHSITDLSPLVAAISFKHAFEVALV